jgi:hypothetical protein
MLKIQGRYNVPHVDLRAAYAPTVGVFALAQKTKRGANRISKWIQCRETFSTRWNQIGANVAVTEFDPASGKLIPASETIKNQHFIIPILMFVEEKQRENIAEFIAITEKKLGLKKPSVITGFANRKYQILIQPSPWWLENEARRQFLTAALRAGEFYKSKKLSTVGVLTDIKDEYERALFSFSYFCKTRPAVEKFLSGHTVYKGTDMLGGSKGWFKIFAQAANSIANLELLVKE